MTCFYCGKDDELHLLWWHLESGKGTRNSFCGKVCLVKYITGGFLNFEGPFRAIENKVHEPA